MNKCPLCKRELNKLPCVGATESQVESGEAIVDDVCLGEALGYVERLNAWNDVPVGTDD